MAAAAFLRQERGMNVKEIEQPQAVKQNVPGVHSEVVAEEDIEIGGTAAEKQHLAVRIDLDILGQSSQRRVFTAGDVMVRMSD